MGSFASKYEAPSIEGPPKLSKEEVAVLIEEGTEFPITAVRAGKSESGPFFVVELELEGESFTKFFGRGTVYTRDDMLENYKQYLEDGGEPERFKLTLSGRSQILVLVDAEV